MPLGNRSRFFALLTLLYVNDPTNKKIRDPIDRKGDQLRDLIPICRMKVWKR